MQHLIYIITSLVSCALSHYFVKSLMRFNMSCLPLIKYINVYGSIKRFYTWPSLFMPIVNEVVLSGLSGLLLSWDLALG